jgi:hypothetical protein
LGPALEWPLAKTQLVSAAKALQAQIRLLMTLFASAASRIAAYKGLHCEPNNARPFWWIFERRVAGREEGPWKSFTLFLA